MKMADLQPHKLVNLRSQLQTPTLMRIDINLPFENGYIAQDAMRLQVYAHDLELCSQYAGLVVTAHQGRKGDEDFSDLRPHYKRLFKMLPDNVEIVFVPYGKVFTEETKQMIGNLKPKQIILLDNVRYFDHEKKFDPDASPYIPFFKGVIKTCVNDAIPAWHRADSSLMCLPYIARTYVGMRSYYELGIIERITESKASKALISGGRKLQKVTDLQKIYKSGIEGFTGGAIAQAILRASGHDLGIENNRFLERIFSAEEFEDAKLIAFMGVRNPVDFKVVENGETRNISLEDMHKSRGMIMDIGDGTVDKYSEDLQAKEIRIRAGPLGVYEKGFKNGIELTRRIAGDGLVFLGGDTSQEVVENGLDQHIISTGGQILISGGSALHRLAGGDFPSINLILEMYGR